MPNTDTQLSAQQLHEIMFPLWEREKELRPRDLLLSPDCRGTHDAYFCTDPDGYKHLRLITDEWATLLCEATMTRRLMKDHKVILNDPDGEPYVILHEPTLKMGDSLYSAPTLLEALAKACNAVLDERRE